MQVTTSSSQCELPQLLERFYVDLCKSEDSSNGATSCKSEAGQAMERQSRSRMSGFLRKLFKKVRPTSQASRGAADVNPVNARQMAARSNMQVAAQSGSQQNGFLRRIFKRVRHNTLAARGSTNSTGTNLRTRPVTAQSGGHMNGILRRLFKKVRPTSPASRGSCNISIQSTQMAAQNGNRINGFLKQLFKKVTTESCKTAFLRGIFKRVRQPNKRPLDLPWSLPPVPDSPKGGSWSIASHSAEAITCASGSSSTSQSLLASPSIREWKIPCNASNAKLSGLSSSLSFNSGKSAQPLYTIRALELVLSPERA